MDSPKFTVDFHLLPETLEKPFTDHFPGHDEGLIRSSPGNFIYSPEYGRYAEKLYHFQPRKDDVWLRTFPRSGTTWTSEMIWLIVNDCDFESARKTPLNYRSPNVDAAFISNWSRFNLPGKSSKDLMNESNLITLETIDKMPSPRVIKTHQPSFTLNPQLLDTCKNIYVVRNPKDVITSYYYYYRLISVLGFEGGIDLYAQYFMDDKVMFAPYFTHVLEAWSQRNHPNMLFLFYEDLKKNLSNEIEKVAQFLGKTLTRDQVQRLTDHLQFGQFEKNESVNFEDVRKAGIGMNKDASTKFIRKGETGDWKNHFNPELDHQVDEWIERNLAGTDLKFVTQL